MTKYDNHMFWKCISYAIITLNVPILSSTAAEAERGHLWIHEVIIFAGNWTSCESYLFEIYWGKFILYFGELFLAKRISATQTKVQVNYYTLSQKTHMHGIQWWPWKRRCPDSRYLAAPRHRWSHRRPGKLSILFWAESVRGQKHSNESKTLDKPKIRKH